VGTHICGQLSAKAAKEGHEDKAQQNRLTQVEAWLAECDAVAESIEGVFDAAEDIRHIRAERADHV